MLTILVLVLVKVITFLGIAALLAIIGYVAYMAISFLLGKIRDYLRKRVGGKVIATSVKPLLKEIAKQKEREGNVQTLTELEEQLKGEGVIIAVQDASGEIDSDDIQITKTDKMDPKLVNYLENNKDGAIVVKDG